MIIDHIHDSVGKYRMGIILESMPEFVKVAHDQLASEDLTKLSSGLFAYSDGVNRYFPINNPGHAALSKGYFEKCANDFNEQDRIKIRSRIDNALSAFGIEDISLPLEKEAANEDETDYLHSLSQDIYNFINNHKKFKAEERRALAKELINRALKLKKSSGMPELVHRYGGNKLHPKYSHEFAERFKYLKAPERQSLLSLQERAQEIDPETVAKALAIFDKKFNLEQHYDTGLNDPYYGLLDYGKMEEKPLHSIGEHLLYKSQLDGFNWDSLEDLFEPEQIQGLKEDHSKLMGLDGPLKIIVIKRITHNGQ